MSAMTKRIGLMLWVGVVATASSAFAHEGHGDPTWYGSTMHYLMEPEHVSVILAIVVVALWVAKRRARSRS